MIELIAGGARSGKSRYALTQAAKLNGSHIFIATAGADDKSMQQRIRRHQEERDGRWRLIEEPLMLSQIINGHGDNDILLIDCLTLYLSNWLCSGQLENWPQEKENFLRSLSATKATVFLVTNEVGMGVVPMGQLSRDFVDESGWLHQSIAGVADKVTLVTFGIPSVLKPKH